jgi:N-acylglucosamine 2-epimerase
MQLTRRALCGMPMALAGAHLDVRTDVRREQTPRQPSATLSLDAVRNRYRKYLFDDFLPFMDRFVIDHRYGGFMCITDYDGTRASDTKDCWFEGRGIWVYAFLYNHLAREQRFLDVARQSAAFILNARPTDGSLWPRQFSRDGNPLAPPETAIYGALFVAEGLQELAHATGDRQHREAAKRLILDCVARYDRNDYEPAIGRTYLGPEARPYPGARIQGVWMVLIRVITQMLEREADRELAAVADRCIDAVVRHHYNRRFRLTNELINHDLSRPDNEYEQLVYTGHAIETHWMLMQEALRRNDGALFDVLRERFRRHVEVAWDNVYGGVFRNLMHVDSNTWTLDKVLWAQEEVLIGSLLVYEHTGEPWAKAMFDRTLDYVEATYPLAKHGSPIWMYAGNRTVDFAEFQKLPKRIEHYHHPRHLMLNLLSLDRLIATSHQVFPVDRDDSVTSRRSGNEDRKP